MMPRPRNEARWRRGVMRGGGAASCTVEARRYARWCGGMLWLCADDGVGSDAAAVLLKVQVARMRAGLKLQRPLTDVCVLAGALAELAPKGRDHSADRVACDAEDMCLVGVRGESSFNFACTQTLT